MGQKNSKIGDSGAEIQPSGWEIIPRVSSMGDVRLSDLVASLDHAKVAALEHHCSCMELLDQPELYDVFRVVPEEIEETAEALDKMHFDVNVTQLASLSTSIVGGAVFGAGAIGTFFTDRRRCRLGLAAPLMITGGVMCGAGVVTGGAANTIEWKVSARRAQFARQRIEPWNTLAKEYSRWESALREGIRAADKILRILDGEPEKVKHILLLRPDFNLDHSNDEVALREEVDQEGFAQVDLLSPDNDFHSGLAVPQVFMVDDGDNVEVHDLKQLLEEEKTEEAGGEEGEKRALPSVEESAEVFPEKMLKFQVAKGFQSGLGVAAAARDVMLAAEAADAGLKFASGFLVPLTAVFIGTDMYFLVRTAKDMKNGSRTEAAEALRETARNIREIQNVEGAKDRIRKANSAGQKYIAAVLDFAKGHLYSDIDIDDIQ